jgi:hypothetical protein
MKKLLPGCMSLSTKVEYSEWCGMLPRFLHCFMTVNSGIGVCWWLILALSGIPENCPWLEHHLVQGHVVFLEYPAYNDWLLLGITCNQLVSVWDDWKVLIGPEFPMASTETFIKVALRFNLSLCPISLQYGNLHFPTGFASYSDLHILLNQLPTSRSSSCANDYIFKTDKNVNFILDWSIYCMNTHKSILGTYINIIILIIWWTLLIILSL